LAEKTSKEKYPMSTIIIGGAGFIGSKLTRHFLQQGNNVLVIHRAGTVADGRRVK
jgi:nucleoside-diphosphate-sugar epimerase